MKGFVQENESHQRNMSVATNANHVTVSWKFGEAVTGDCFEVKSRRVQKLRDAFFLEMNDTLNFKHRSQVIFYQSDNDNKRKCDLNNPLDWEATIPNEYFHDPSTATATRPPTLWVLPKAKEVESESTSEGDGNTVPTDANQAAASAFAVKGSDKKILQGIGTLPPGFFEHLVPANVKRLFTDRIQEIENNSGDQRLTDELNELSTIFMSLGTPYNLDYVPETDRNSTSEKDPNRKLSVQKDVLDRIAVAFDDRITTERRFKDGLSAKGNKRRSLEEIGLEDGIATAGSFPDGYFHTREITNLKSKIRFITTAIFECKDTTASPDLGHAEGVANATNAAVAMVKHGMPASDVVIPVFTTTGGEVQVAAVYMLEPCFPAVCFVTKKLDMNDEKERLKAATVLVAMSLHNRAVEDSIQTKIQENSLRRNESIKMGLSKDKYHLKSMNVFYEVFEDRRNKSLTHMLEVTSRLAGSDYFCLPLGVRLKDDNMKVDAIIFPKLADYCIGFPQDDNDRESLLTEMEKAVKVMHEKNVVHNDLYLSNFMWKMKDDGTFSVKIIDFDAAHKLNWLLTDRTRKIIRKVMPQIENDKAIKERDLLYMKMLRNQIDNPKLLNKSSNYETEKDVKRRLDGVCEAYIRNVELDVDETARGMAGIDISE